MRLPGEWRGTLAKVPGIAETAAPHGKPRDERKSASKPCVFLEPTAPVERFSAPAGGPTRAAGYGRSWLFSQAHQIRQAAAARNCPNDCALSPFFGAKIWCRYWCPLAKLMEMWSAFYTRRGVSRFGIRSNDKCIACGECTRNCQVGIDVMSFALKQEPIHNGNTSCIGCGICVTVCPMGVLSFGRPRVELVQIQAGGAAE